MNDRDFDVVVVGSGAAGLMAALVAGHGGKKVVVLEKHELIGGTSAWSGGMPWLPMNHHELSAGIEDTREDVLSYIAAVDDGRSPNTELIEAFVDAAGPALAFLEDATALKMSTVSSYPDYYSNLPGSRRVGRSLEPIPLSARDLLGDWYPRVRDSPLMKRLTREEMTRGVEDEATLLVSRERSGIRTLGSALVSGLLAGVLDFDVDVQTGVHVRELLIDGGRVTGVKALVGEDEAIFTASDGVVLAAGGFEWNQDMVRAYLGAASVLPLSPKGNDGEILQRAMELGAAVSNMTSAVGRPCTYDGVTEFEGQPLPFMAIPRHDAGCVVVDKSGYRFANEGASYADMGKALRSFRPGRGSPDSGPVWMIFDADARERISVGDFVPGEPTPEWAFEAPTLEALADRIGIDPSVLSAEIGRYNRSAEIGIDERFGRGTMWFEGLSTGGPSPSKNLAAVFRAPFYAMQMFPGIFGTTGGLVVDAHARVRRWDQRVIPGLYAVGNVAANPLGSSYPGGGSSLGPNLAFGYLAGRHLIGDI